MAGAGEGFPNNLPCRVERERDRDVLGREAEQQQVLAAPTAARSASGATPLAYGSTDRNWLPVTSIGCGMQAPVAASLVTRSYTVIARTWRSGASAWLSAAVPGAGGHGTSSELVSTSCPALAAA